MGWYLPPRRPHSLSTLVTAVTLHFSGGWRKEEAKGSQNVRRLGDGQSCGSWSRLNDIFCCPPPTWCRRKEQITLLLGTDAWLAACSSADSSDPQVEAVNRRLIKLTATTMQLSLTFLLRTLNKPHHILSRTRTNILIRSKRETASEWRAEGARGAETINMTLKSAGPTFNCHSRSSCCWALLGAPEPSRSRWGGTNTNNCSESQF